MRTIPLTKGMSAKVDDADYDKLARHKWHASVCKGGRVYAVRTVTVDGRRKSRRYRRVYMHHDVTGKPDDGVIDPDAILEMSRAGGTPQVVERLERYGVTYVGQRHHSERASVEYPHHKISFA